MAIYVKNSGTWREISSSSGGQVFVRDGTSFTNKTINNVYVKDGGTWRTVFTLFETTGFQTTTGTVTVPANANAIHIQYAVGSGGGGYIGTAYDKAGGESSGPGGGSGAYVSDVVYALTGGENLTIATANGGAAGTGYYSGTAGGGTATVISGSTTGSIFSLAGGGASSVSGGGVQGPLRSNTAGTGGSATLSASRLTSFTTVDGLTQNDVSFRQGPIGTFNSTGSGVTGGNNGNCGGDNCQINGSAGAASYNGLSGTAGAGGQVGTPATAGTRGGGGAGGGAENYGSGAAGSVGGPGEINYRFLRTV